MLGVEKTLSNTGCPWPGGGTVEFAQTDVARLGKLYCWGSACVQFIVQSCSADARGSHRSDGPCTRSRKACRAPSEDRARDIRSTRSPAVRRLVPAAATASLDLRSRKRSTQADRRP
jgi:hypothetical protein